MPIASQVRFLTPLLPLLPLPPTVNYNLQVDPSSPLWTLESSGSPNLGAGGAEYVLSAYRDNWANNQLAELQVGWGRAPQKSGVAFFTVPLLVSGRSQPSWAENFGSASRFGQH